MFNWFRKKKARKTPTITISGTGPVLASLERLNESHALHLIGSAQIQNSKSEAEFSVVISDAASLRQIYALLKNALHTRDEYEELLADQGLLEGEPINIFEDIYQTLGSELARVWIHQPNVHLNLKTPHQMIREGYPWRVREILRQIKYVGVS